MVAGEKEAPLSTRAGVVAIVPAAGYATRLQPLNCSKELIRVKGKPVIDHLIGRLEYAVSPNHIFVVTRAEKTDVIEHARAGGHQVTLGTPPHVSASLLLGLEAATAVAVGPAPETVIFGFPDTIFSPADVFAQLLDALAPPADVVLGLFESPEPERGDVVDVTPDGWVRSVVPKPGRPATNLIWGLAAARAQSLHALESVVEPGEAFSRMASEGRVRGVRLGSDYVDIGVPDVLHRLAPEFFPQREED